MQTMELPEEQCVHVVQNIHISDMSSSASPFQWAWSRTCTPRLDAGLRPGKVIHRARHGSWTRLRAVFILEVAVLWLGRLYSCICFDLKCQPDTSGLKTCIFPNPTYRWTVVEISTHSDFTTVIQCFQWSQKDRHWVSWVGTGWFLMFKQRYMPYHASDGPRSGRRASLESRKTILVGYPSVESFLSKENVLNKSGSGSCGYNCPLCVLPVYTDTELS